MRSRLIRFGTELLPRLSPLKNLTLTGESGKPTLGTCVDSTLCDRLHKVIVPARSPKAGAAQGADSMRLGDVFALALSAIWGHKLRSFLTLLGVIFGVATVIVVVSLIEGFNAYIDEKIADI